MPTGPKIMFADTPSQSSWVYDRFVDKSEFGRSPRPGKWKNLKELTVQDVESFKRKQSPVER